MFSDFDIEEAVVDRGRHRTSEAGDVFGVRDPGGVGYLVHPPENCLLNLGLSDTQTIREGCSGLCDGVGGAAGVAGQIQDGALMNSASP